MLTWPGCGRGLLMKQARCWLLLVAALLLLPQAAFAQPKKPAGGRGKPPPTAPIPAPTPAPATAPAPAPAGGEIEIDDPNAPKAAEQAPAEQPTTPPGGDSGALDGGICEIDPTACPK